MLAKNKAFHVKQNKIKKPLTSFVAGVLKNKQTMCTLDDWGALPLIVKTLKEPCFIECEQGCFDEVVSSFDFLSDQSVFVPDVSKEKASFSKTYHEEMFERASVLISSSSKTINLFIVDSGAIDTPLFYKQKDGFLDVLGGGESKEPLLDFLLQNNYSRVDIVDEPGEYSLRGGVVDVFSFGSSLPFRVGFLGGGGGALYFDTNTGSVLKESEVGRVYANPKKPLYTIKEMSNKIKISMRCFKKTLKITNLSVLKETINIDKKHFKSIDYNSYKKKSNKNIYFSSSLLSRGFQYEKTFYLPNWFSNKSEKSVVKKIPLVGVLSVGDFYVHEQYGICQYTGSVPGSSNNKKGFVSLKFEDGKLSLDLDLLGQIYFYAPLSAGCKLGSLSKKKSWDKKRKKAVDNASVFIKEILSSYAKRESSLVFPYKKNQSLINLFLSEFNFLDTPDQSLAWKEIFKDLCSERPMHRLLCGDVGFGKTEIAIRAVFHAFTNNKQSIVLSPTTLLSQQLFSCFSQRLSSFGCKINQISRLTQKNKDSISSFINEKTDVLIGTHSIIKRPEVLSKASLLIVDEEHRFGVKDKEKIMSFSPNCNYLSMSATPIPRTLQLALSGIRNISTLLSPPVERKPIITNIHGFDASLVENYFLKEINRGGQVYFVDNSVDSLKQKYLFFKKRLPNIFCDFLYGGMDKKSIKSAMLAFRNKKTKILFSTTIIESGIDISSANTIVINNAHMFGLSQLHQLRGRVGRSNKQSYACLLIPKNKKITADGEARLQSIKKYSSLGSGYSLALEDLQIRGSGSLFGYSQSGESVVGFDYYSKILSKTMSLGRAALDRPDPVVSFDNAYIPQSLMEDESQQVFYYKKIFDCINKDSLSVLLKETSDLFGPLPSSMLLVFKCKELAFLAQKTPVVGIKKIKEIFIITISSFGLKDISFFLKKVSVFFNSEDLLYGVSSDSNFLKIKFSYVKEDPYILLEKFLIKTHV